MIEYKESESNNKVEHATDEERRSFLRKSIYVAYTTPLIMSMLVEKASAFSIKRGPQEPPPPPQD